MKKNVKLLVIILTIIFLINGSILIVSSYSSSRDKDWGLKISASDISSSGLKLTLKRSNGEKNERLLTDDSYWLQKWTLFGWKNIDTVGGEGIVSIGVASYVENGGELNWNINWERDFGKLLPGIYRINKKVESSSSGSDIDEYNKELYATFVVIF